MPEAASQTPGITLTGADERTAVADLIRLADLGAEIGLLYTFDPEGRHRYPPLTWIGSTAKALQGRTALHVCGSRARAALCRGNLDWLLDDVRRIQVNGTVTPKELRWLCDCLTERTVITQHTKHNDSLLGVPVPNHAILVDASGGRGRLPEAWQRPDTDKHVGFAGGLGPHTLGTELPKIVAVAVDPWWVDMEGQLRDEDDWFDVQRALTAVRVWQEFNSAP